MALNHSVPVYFLDAGPHFAHAQHYWRKLCAAQRTEMEGTFGELLPVPGAGSDDPACISTLPTPSVLVVPAVAGGRVQKDWGAWWRFRAALRTYRAAGGVVVVLEAAAHLPAEGQKARGRNFFGMDRDPQLPGTTGEVTLLVGDSPVPVATVNAHGLRVWSEWRYVGEGGGVPPVPIAFVEGTGGRFTVAWRWQGHEWEQPGAMLFLSSWGWIGRDEMEEKAWTQKPFDREVIGEVRKAYRRMNHEIVARTVADTLRRAGTRLRRLELLTGESERLPHRTGREKDYHRLLVNDQALLVDLVSWRALVGVDDGGASAAFHELFRLAEVINEPGHAKGNGGSGRLDILLRSLKRGAPPEEGGLAYLAQPGRSPVAWIELEAGGIHLHQMNEFLRGEGAKLGASDWVVAVDRSHDDEPSVAQVRSQVAELGARFLHVQVPHGFARLEEHYVPEMHRVSRKRYTLDVIRGLLG
ncbi:MAG: hypothetical protein V4850_01195 [Myxococcota bacterium]